MLRRMLYASDPRKRYGKYGVKGGHTGQDKVEE